MNSSHRIALNTVVTYTRTVLGAGLALLSSRWVLDALGAIDFGLFSLVGSIIVFITFVNITLSGSAARHYAFSIGQGDAAEVNRWFNAAFSMHLVLAAALVVLGWAIGESVITNVLNIPPDRLAACRWVFRVSLVSAFANIVSVPFVAMFKARQRIAELAVWNITHSVLVFVLALSLSRLPGDRLVGYAVGMVSILVFVQGVQVARALTVFVDCRITHSYWFDGYRVKALFSFAGWYMIGSFAAMLRNQGSAILLNLHSGPAVNAAYGIANQVSAQLDQLAAAMTNAFSPEITTCEGRGDRARMLSLSRRTSKFGTLLFLLLAVPLFAEIDFILKVWLREPPEFTATFCRLIVAMYLFQRLSTGNALAVQAYGKIAAFHLTLSVLLFATLPLAWLFLTLGAPPTSVGVAFVLTMAAVALGRVFWTRWFFGVSAMEWVKSVVLPSAVVGLLSALTATAMIWLFPMSFLRLVLVIGGCVAATTASGWFLALDKTERQFFVQIRRSAFNKFGRLMSKNKSNDVE